MRWTLPLLVLIWCALGCEAGSVVEPGRMAFAANDGGMMPAEPEGDLAADFFTDNIAEPMRTSCGGCHSNGATDFVKDPLMESVLAYPGMVTPGDPTNSLIYNFPNGPTHPGQGWDDVTLGRISFWVDLVGENAVIP